MALTAQQQADVRGAITKALSNVREPFALSKGELLAAVAATDAWIDSNAASYNQALPAAAQSGLTAQQKARLFMAVAEARFLNG